MRLFIINLLVAALLAFSASTASAITLTMAGADGQTVVPDDQVIITVTVDSEATIGITLWSIGVLFDDTRLSYNQAASSTASYVFYAAGRGNNFMTAVPSCGGYPAAGPPQLAGAGCAEVLPGQVNIDHTSTSLTAGTGANNVGVAQLVELVFDVLPEAASGSAPITISQTATGNTIGTAGGNTTMATLSGSGSVNVVPEPGVAALMVAAIMTAGGLRARERRRP